MTLAHGTLVLWGHPFSSYTWKALIALYANETPFEFDPGGAAPGKLFIKITTPTD